MTFTFVQSFKHLKQSTVLQWRIFFRAACFGPLGPRAPCIAGSAGAVVTPWYSLSFYFICQLSICHLSPAKIPMQRNCLRMHYRYFVKLLDLLRPSRAVGEATSGKQSGKQLIYMWLWTYSVVGLWELLSATWLPEIWSASLERLWTCGGHKITSKIILYKTKCRFLTNCSTHGFTNPHVYCTNIRWQLAHGTNLFGTTYFT